MKKSVVILIGIIYVASIALVNFFGLDFKMFNEVVYVESIEILDDNLKENELFGKYAVIYPDENGEWKYQISYRVHPDNVTDTKVEFAYDKQTPGVTVDQNGIVTFTQPGSVMITLIPHDGSEARATITIVAKAPK